MALKTTGLVAARREDSAGNQREVFLVLRSYCKGLVMDRAHIAQAYALWEKARAGHKNAWRVPKEYGSADALIDELVAEIDGRCLKLRPIKRYEHIEPTNGKTRIIGVESVKQQVLDYAIVLALQPMLAAKIGHWQVAGVPGRGQCAARNAMRKWVQEGGYHVKLAIRQCYPSISHKVVRRMVRKYVRSTDVLYCVDAILDTYGEGLEIGSYFSLQMAILVVSFGYHHLEGLGKKRRGKWVPLITHQVWHMDDGLILARDKRNLKVAIRSLERYMREEFGLEFKPWKVARTDDIEPLDMGGFVVREGRCTLRAPIFKRAKRAFARFRRLPSLRLAQRVCSYWGWITNTDSDGFILRNNLRKLFKVARSITSRAGKAEQRCIQPKALPS